MNQFETKLTVRIYDTKLIESLNTIFKLNRNRYQTKNQLIVELLERGIKDKMKDFPTPPDSPAGASAIPPIFTKKDDTAAMLKQLKDMLSDMHSYNKQHIEGLLAHLKMSEKMSACMRICTILQRCYAPLRIRTSLCGRAGQKILCLQLRLQCLKIAPIPN